MQAFIEDFTGTASTFRTLFPRAEAQLTHKTQELYREYFSHVQGALQPATGTPRAADLVAAIKTLSDDTHLMHDVVPDAGLYKKAAEVRLVLCLRACYGFSLPLLPERLAKSSMMPFCLAGNVFSSAPYPPSTAV